MSVFQVCAEGRLSLGARFVALGVLEVIGRKAEIPADVGALASCLFPEGVDLAQFKRWMREVTDAGIVHLEKAGDGWWLKRGDGKFQLSGEAKEKRKRERGPVYMTFPVQGTDREWVLTIPEYERFVELYPALDVAQALRGALAFVDFNVANRKTSRGMRTFIVAWLNREVAWSRSGKSRPISFESREGRVRGDLSGALNALGGD